MSAEDVVVSLEIPVHVAVIIGAVARATGTTPGDIFRTLLEDAIRFRAGDFEALLSEHIRKLTSAQEAAEP